MYSSFVAPSRREALDGFFGRGACTSSISAFERSAMYLPFQAPVLVSPVFLRFVHCEQGGPDENHSIPLDVNAKVKAVSWCDCRAKRQRDDVLSNEHVRVKRGLAAQLKRRLLSCGLRPGVNACTTCAEAGLDVDAQSGGDVVPWSCVCDTFRTRL